MDHVGLTEEPGHDEGSDTSRPTSGGGFWTSSAEKEEHLAALRGVFGDEVLETMRRNMALHEHPRPLTDREREVLREAAAPVLRDIAASGAIGLLLREEARADRGDEIVCAWASGAGDITGVDIWVALGSSAAERVAELAEQLQEWEVEALWAAGRSATWPECPEHPNSHPLEPVVEGGHGAVWRCPRSGAVICAIGALGSRG
ncbi:MAG TPA: hypothetical protein VIX15_08175 [Streptosporangiaceae bacterium]